MPHLHVINDIDPLKTEHVCWRIGDSVDRDCIQLIEVVKVTYRHPEAPEHAIVQQLEERTHKVVNKYTRDIDHLKMLEHIQNTVSLIELPK